MNSINFERVASVPDAPANNTIYFVSEGSDHFEFYLKGNAESGMRRMLTRSDINRMISSAVSGLSALQVVDEISDRDVLNIVSNALVLVKDASADSSVSSGSAMYVGEPDDGNAGSAPQWTKVAEFESLDVVLSWGNIQGRPNSSVADIDDAVGKRHMHANVTQLDKIGQDAVGNLIYDGAPVKISWDALAW